MQARLAVLLLLTLPAVRAAAQQEPLPPPSQEPAEEEDSRAEERKLVEETSVPPTPGAPTISLQDAVARALEANFGILNSADAVESARLREWVAEAQFIPKFTPSYQVNPDDRSVLATASQKLPWTGGSLNASMTLRSSELTVPELSHTGDLRLVLTQPLLRGFGPNATYFEIKSSRRGRQGQERVLELARQRLALQVTASFYGVIAQRQLLAVSRQSLKRGEDLRRASEARLKVGLVSKLDVFRADLQASQTQEALVRSETALDSSLEQFRALLGLAASDPVEPQNVPLPERIDDELEPMEALLARALANRLELQEARDQVEDAKRAASLAKQNRLPQLDVNLGYVRSGFGRTYHDALRENVDNRVEVYFNTAYPVENAAARASQAVAELDVAARERTVAQRALEIESELRAAVRELERIKKSVELQRKGVAVAAQQVRLSTLRYQRGLASNFDVVDAEGSLVLARSALVGLLASYEIARAELRRATGTLDVGKDFGAARTALIREPAP